MERTAHQFGEQLGETSGDQGKSSVENGKARRLKDTPARVERHRRVKTVRVIPRPQQVSASEQLDALSPGANHIAAQETVEDKQPERPWRPLRFGLRLPGPGAEPLLPRDSMTASERRALGGKISRQLGDLVEDAHGVGAVGSGAVLLHSAYRWGHCGSRHVGFLPARFRRGQVM